MPDLLLGFVLAVYASIFVVLFAYGANFLYLTWMAIRHPADAATPVDPTEWPTVTVQLPIFNEVYVAERLIDAVVRLDYPAESLEIQVLDDSTDDTVLIVGALVARWQRLGVDIRHVHRAHRTGFKAGALAAGMASARGTLIAIFDADFVPPRDFLRRSVPVLAADPGLAFVQARWGHTNRDDSLLTSLQALSLDGHFAVEQRARAAGGQWFNFNGTAGIWRRAALVDAGGWHLDTLTEDLDISYRAFLHGWRAAYLGQLEVPAELPVSINAYRRQQHRWARGSFECSFKHLPGIWRSTASRPVKAEATLHLTGYSIHLLLLLLSLLYPLILVVAVRYPTVMSAVGFLGLFALMFPVPGVLFAVGQRQIGRRWIRVIPRIAMLSVLSSGMMINTGRAAWQALHAVPGTFERTPKFGRRHEPGDWRRMRYQVAIDRIVILELVLAAVNCASFWMAVRQGSWAIAIYAGLFAAGLLFVDSLTISQTVRSALATRRAGEPVLQPGEPVLHR
jgi:cellulose synthase/poly-beta-1,6-N-acetylglucosamine synthase-like glycosyltransferase